MRTIKYRPEALLDLESIWSYVAEHDEHAADGLIDRLRRSVLRLIDHSRSAPARPDLGKALRSLSSHNHQLIYRIVGDVIEIIRVVDARRDVRTVVRRGIR